MSEELVPNYLKKLEEISGRIDQIADLIETSLGDNEDIQQIKSIIDELRSNLIHTIDDRILLFLNKEQKSIEQLEKLLSELSNKNESNYKDIEQRLNDKIKELKDDMIEKYHEINNKISTHLDEEAKSQKDLKELIIKSLVGSGVTVGLGIVVLIVDKVFELGIVELIISLGK